MPPQGVVSHGGVGASYRRPAKARAGPLRVMLVDDHPIVHQGVEHLVERTPGIQICSRALTAAEGQMLAGLEWPDVVLLDLHLPDMSIAEASTALRQTRPGLKIILFSGDGRRATCQVARLAGMEGALHKDGACASLIVAIREVAAGRRFFDPLFDASGPLQLSPRESQVLHRLAMGESNAEIARALGLASNTVKSYVQSLLTHLDARNRLDAVVKAQRAGLL